MSAARERSPVMATKQVPVDDLRTLRAALDAPARERAEAEARAREAEQRVRQDGALTYAREIRARLETARTASAAWDAAPVDLTALRREFGETVPVWQASDAVNSGSAASTSAAGHAGAVDRLIPELERPGVLPAARLAQIVKALDTAAEHAEGFRAAYPGWIRVRQAGVALLPAIRGLLDALERRWTPTAAERALLQQHQAWFSAATAAMPPVPPKAPRPHVGGADFDAEPPRSGTRRPLLENMEDL